MQSDSHRAQLAIRPTPFTLYLRRSLPWQLWRFIIINLRMTVMILKSHHTRLHQQKPPASRPSRDAPSALSEPAVRRSS